MGAPQLTWSQLAGLSRRLAISVRAGIDLRRTWEREAASARWPVNKALIPVRDAVLAGETMREGMERAGRGFPPLYREMVGIGERTGHTAEVFLRLAEHYDHRVKMRRTFLQSLVWPAFQLGTAITVVGLLIWVMGLIATRTGQPVDVLGFGLIGTPGLITYASYVGGALTALALLIATVRRGIFWARPLKTAALHIPAVGNCLRTLALARMAWTLHLTMNTEMNLRQIMPLGLRSTGFEWYSQHAAEVLADVVSGREIHEALRRTRKFPPEFLAVIEVGETTGELVESLGRLTDQYEERAQASVAILTRIAGFAVWACVAGLIIVVIMRLASFYVSTINNALNG